jgi:hypothetical protein
MLVEIKSKVDRLLARAIAKIAFNFMAFHAGRSLLSARTSIRCGDSSATIKAATIGESLSVFSLDRYSLRRPKTCRVTRGHILILGWRDFETLVVWVRPYNSMAYEVTLTRSYLGVWPPLKLVRYLTGSITI